MEKNIELLAPGGDLDSIKAAIVAGANAVYCGLAKFNARNRAVNIEFDDLVGVINLAHAHDCQVFLTMNIMVTTSEIASLVKLLNRLVNTGLDAVIVQDLGLFYLLSTYFPQLSVHASTQLTTHNAGQIDVAKLLGANRVNLSRELSLKEIGTLATYAHEKDVSIEVFVHGSNCIGFSGLCYFSSVKTANSGNRGRCSQPCRDEFKPSTIGNKFPLNLKDNSAFSDIKELVEAGVDSIKIEGRIKKYHYVHTIVDTWRKQLQYFYDHGVSGAGNSNLHKVFNRDFSNHLLHGTLDKDAFIDNPRDNSALHRAASYGDEVAGISNIDRAKRELYDEKTEIIESVKDQISELEIEEIPVEITVAGVAGEKLGLSVTTPTRNFTLFSKHELIVAGQDKPSYDSSKKKSPSSLASESILSVFKSLSDLGYCVKDLSLSSLDDGLFIPFSDLRNLGKQVFTKFNNSRPFQAAVSLAKIKSGRQDTPTPKLSVLISSFDDLHLCDDQNEADVYFQLPSSLAGMIDEYVQIFKGRKITPWFPAVIIGDDFQIVEAFMRELQPEMIITNNLGVAHLANKLGIKWLAGPYINIANPYSLICLQEKLSCSGAFISNELNASQIRSLHGPDGFEMCYSIFHPIMLLTSRQCLFHPVIGCGKHSTAEKCLRDCEKTSQIENVDGTILTIKKNKGGYHALYNTDHFLNTDIIQDAPNRFDRLFIDLSSYQETKSTSKVDLIHLFQELTKGGDKEIAQIKNAVGATTNSQYQNGI